MNTIQETILEILKLYDTPHTITGDTINIKKCNDNYYDVKIILKNNNVRILIDQWENMTCNCQAAKKDNNIYQLELLKKILSNKIILEIYYANNKPYKWETFELDQNNIKSLGIMWSFNLNWLAKRHKIEYRYKNA